MVSNYTQTSARQADFFRIIFALDDAGNSSQSLAAVIASCCHGDHGIDRRDKLPGPRDRKSTRLNSSHITISYAVFCLKKKKRNVKKILYKENDKQKRT